ncbi:hypothetical protein AYI68_g4073 [Smittium mucronatum]|uniref:Uncharacterized protein n=1 Tax=Smittium mucronatum TaxID=133383 RepID=A0A1R0GY99_9FUNG|nr:hypothetical protein AYI68_g4073 [Smittium mucronatum]
MPHTALLYKLKAVLDWREVTQPYLGSDIKVLYVHVITSRIPGPLFDDNAVVLGESETEKKIELNQIND